MEAESRSAKRTVEEANHDCENFSLATASNSLQLKTDFKSSKQEVVVMQEHLEKQKKLMHDKR